MELILLFLAVYILPFGRLIWCVFSKKLKKLVIRRNLFFGACLIHGLVCLINATAITILLSLEAGGASGVPLAFLLPVQLLLIVTAENFLKKSKKSENSSM